MHIISQEVLKGLVESVMGRAEDLSPEGESGSSGAAQQGSVEGVEDLQISANLTEKEQLRFVFVSFVFIVCVVCIVCIVSIAGQIM